MGKLRVLSGQEVTKILAEHGFVLVRQRGSHMIMQKRTDESTVTVPIPNYTELRIGTLKSIERLKNYPCAIFLDLFTLEELEASVREYLKIHNFLW